MCQNWENYTLKKQLNIVFCSLIFVSLAIIEIIAICYVTLIIKEIKNDSFSSLSALSQNNMKYIVTDNARLFETQFQGSIQNFLSPIMFSMEDTYRNDFPFNLTIAYYDWPNLLAPPIIFDSRYNEHVSFSHSSYNIYNKTVYDVPNSSPELLNLIDRTASVDPIFKVVYADSPQFLSGYTGFQLNGLFVEYPGTTSDNVNILISYDPRKDDWYLNAQQNQGNFAYTSPYYDIFVQQRMITISHATRNIKDGTIVGASGADILIRQLDEIIREIRYFNSFSLLLETDTGLVVSDSRNVLTNETLYLDPEISNDNWNNIIANNDYFSETDNYYFQSVKLNISDGKYVIMIFVPKQDIFNSFNSMIQDLDHITETFIIIMVVLLPFILIITLVSATYLVNYLVAPIQKIINDANTIIDNVGSSNIFGNIDIIKSENQIDETKEMQAKYNNFIITNNSNSNSNNAYELVINPFYVAPPIQQLIVPLPPVSQLPSAPYFNVIMPTHAPPPFEDIEIKEHPK